VYERRKEKHGIYSSPSESYFNFQKKGINGHFWNSIVTRKTIHRPLMWVSWIRTSNRNSLQYQHLVVWSF
jgi:hypothetical protein